MSLQGYSFENFRRGQKNTLAHFRKMIVSHPLPRKLIRV